uniref:Uncharacterized protein n=1 Tax=Oryza sativa subsp. japonica TaxID=39947 RepID=Q652A5_ORYSJ|nr:hypothetical protein [Oryza sativa Japonica Group]
MARLAMTVRRNAARDAGDWRRDRGRWVMRWHTRLGAAASAKVEQRLARLAATVRRDAGGRRATQGRTRAGAAVGAMAEQRPAWLLGIGQRAMRAAGEGHWAIRAARGTGH